MHMGYSKVGNIQNERTVCTMQLMHAYNMCMYVHACICWDVYVVNMQKYAVNVQAIQVLQTDTQTDTPMEPGDYKGYISM